jgi:hypothetical protein
LTTVAQMAESCEPPTALPQLSATLPPGSGEIPNVSPGQMFAFPYWRETMTGPDSQPCRSENGRRYSAYPPAALSASQATYAVPGFPPATSTMCVALPVSGVTRIGGDQVLPWSAENDSQPMSVVVPWVSQVMYRSPAASSPIAPSIHHSASDIVPAAAPIRTGVDHVVPPSLDWVKYVYPGFIA